MDFNQEDSLFVLRLMDFVYKLAGKPLQTCLQQMLNEYPESRESYFSENITQAISMYIQDFKNSDINLVDLASPAYQDKMEDLFKFYDSFDFLKFLAHYSLKSAEEYYSKKLLDSPTKFFSSIVLFLEKMRKAGRCDDDFWKVLEAAATGVIARDCEVIESENRNFEDVSEDETMASEREFILKVMRKVTFGYRKSLPRYLCDDSFGYHQSVENALEKAMENLDMNLLSLGSDNSICEYLYGLCKNNFTAKDFLEYCVCSTRRAMCEFFDDSKEDSPQKAFERLFSLVQTAKKAGKYYSMPDFIVGALEIIENENEQDASFQRKLHDVSTNLFSDVSSESNEPNSDEENLITRCDCPGKDSNFRQPNDKAMSPIEEAKLATEKATTSDQNPQSANLTLNISEKIAQSATKKGIILKKELAALTLITPENNAESATEKGISTENAQLTDNSIISGGNAQVMDTISTEGHSQLASENASIPGTITQSTVNTGINFGENVLQAFDSLTISSEKEQSSSEKEIISSAAASDENSQLAKATLVTPEENAESAIEKVISTENAQLTDSSIISGENAQVMDTISTEEHSQLASEDASIPGTITQSTVNTEINFGENVQAIVGLTISSEKVQSSSEKETTSSDRTKEAS